MLEFASKDGYVFYLNHLISFLILAVSFTWACWELQKPKKDMGLHYIACVSITFLGLTFLGLVGLSIYWWAAPILAMLVGLGKEIADYLNPKKRQFDPKDLLGDFIGTATVTIVYGISWLGHNPLN